MSAPPPVYYYVDAATGDDTAGDGLSWATAWATIRKALGAAVSGGHIYVKDGTYELGNSTTRLQNVTKTQYTSVEAAPGHTPVVNTAFFSTVKYLRFIGIRFAMAAADHSLDFKVHKVDFIGCDFD